MAKEKLAKIGEPATQRITDFSGGLNTTIHPALLNSNEAQIADDVSFEQKGTIVPRRGRRRRYTVPFNDKPCTGLGAYYKKDGTTRLLVGSGDKLFSDKPHLSTKYDTNADFDKGTYFNVKTKDDALVVDLPVTYAITSPTGATALGEEKYTYGWKFKAKKKIRLYKLRFLGVVDKPYKLTLWEVSTKKALFTKTITPKKDEWEDVYLNTFILIDPDVEYIVSAYCETKEAFKKYSGGTLSGDIASVGCFEKQGDEFPETSVSTSYISLNIGFDANLIDTKTFSPNLKVIPTGVNITRQDDLSSGTLEGLSVRPYGLILANGSPKWVDYIGVKWTEVV